MENISLLLSGECSRGLPCISFNSDENWDVIVLNVVLNISVFSCQASAKYRDPRSYPALGSNEGSK